MQEGTVLSPDQDTVVGSTPHRRGGVGRGGRSWPVEQLLIHTLNRDELRDLIRRDSQRCTHRIVRATPLRRRVSVRTRVVSVLLIIAFFACAWVLARHLHFAVVIYIAYFAAVLLIGRPGSSLPRSVARRRLQQSPAPLGSRWLTSRWRTILCMSLPVWFLTLVAFLILMQVGDKSSNPAEPFTPLAIGLLMSGLAAAPAWAIVGHRAFWAHRVRRAILEQTCMRCRYPLRGLPGHNCPECGYDNETTGLSGLVGLSGDGAGTRSETPPPHPPPPR